MADDSSNSDSAYRQVTDAVEKTRKQLKKQRQGRKNNPFSRYMSRFTGRNSDRGY